MNIPAATRIDDRTNKRAKQAHSVTHLKMADLLRIGLLRVLTEFEETGTISAGVTAPSKTLPKKGGQAR